MSTTYIDKRTVFFDNPAAWLGHACSPGMSFVSEGAKNLVRSGSGAIQNGLFLPGLGGLRDLVRPLVRVLACAAFRCRLLAVFLGICLAVAFSAAISPAFSGETSSQVLPQELLPPSWPEDQPRSRASLIQPDVSQPATNSADENAESWVWAVNQEQPTTPRTQASSVPPVLYAPQAPTAFPEVSPPQSVEQSNQVQSEPGREAARRGESQAAETPATVFPESATGMSATASPTDIHTNVNRFDNSFDAPCSAPPRRRFAMGRLFEGLGNSGKWERWTDTPGSAGIFLGYGFGTELLDDWLEERDGIWGGVRLGWDFTEQYGAETRLSFASLDLWDHPNAVAEAQRQGVLGDHDRYARPVEWDVVLLYYPTENDPWRPYILWGGGITRIDFTDYLGTSYEGTYFTMPVGIGLKFRPESGPVMRFELVDQIVFPSRFNVTHHFAFTVGLELRFGKKRRIYWPWESSSGSW